jgi:phosphohistidine phosphatase SixA
MTFGSTRCPIRRCAIALAVIAGLGVNVHAQQFAPVPPPAPGRSSTPAKPLSNASLLAELKRGGYTIYIRHTSTDFSRDDMKSRADDDCDNQRPLTDKGRYEARSMGNEMKRAGFPISEVLASPRCRTVEVAKLAFGDYKLAEEVRGGAITQQPVERYAPLVEWFRQGPGAGRNRVIVSHGNPFYATAGAPYLAEGEAAVVKPLGKDFEVIARVRWDGWGMSSNANP